jgi:hypothetical protein
VPDSVLRYTAEHGGGTIATEAQSSAALNIIDQNAKVAGIGGFSGVESDPSISWLAGEVASGHIRWIYVEGPSSDAAGRAGATAAISAAEQACTQVSRQTNLYDCAGRAAALRAAA